MTDTLSLARIAEHRAAQCESPLTTTGDTTHTTALVVLADVMVVEATEEMYEDDADKELKKKCEDSLKSLRDQFVPKIFEDDCKGMATLESNGTKLVAKEYCLAPHQESGLVKNACLASRVNKHVPSSHPMVEPVNEFLRLRATGEVDFKGDCESDRWIPNYNSLGIDFGKKVEQTTLRQLTSIMAFSAPVHGLCYKLKIELQGRVDSWITSSESKKADAKKKQDWLDKNDCKLDDAEIHEKEIEIRELEKQVEKMSKTVENLLGYVKAIADECNKINRKVIRSVRKYADSQRGPALLAALGKLEPDTLESVLYKRSLDAHNEFGKRQRVQKLVKMDTVAKEIYSDIFSDETNDVAIARRDRILLENVPLTSAQIKQCLSLTSPPGRAYVVTGM